ALDPPIEDEQPILIPDDMSDEIIDDELIAPEAKNKEVFVNTLLDDQTSLAVESYRIPSYQLDWHFINKDTIRVTFRLYTFPRQTNHQNDISYSSASITPVKNRKTKKPTTTTTSSPPLSSIHYLKYYVFVIKHYKTMKERALSIQPLIIIPKNQSITKTEYISTTLRLTGLNKKEKYSVCLCYYQTNSSQYRPDFLLCQDIINDYSKFKHHKSNDRNELFFIITQYSIIIALLIALQSVYTMRKRRIAHILHQHLIQKAHTFRHTLSSVSLVRQSLASLDTATTAGEHHRNGGNSSGTHKTSHALDEFDHKLQNVLHESTINEEEHLSPPNIIINNDDEQQGKVKKSASTVGSNSDEKEPFLKHIHSKNHVHFLLGSNTPEASDDEDDEEKKKLEQSNTNFLQSYDERILAKTEEDNENAGPYNEHSDAVQCMKHILDTAKPWTAATTIASLSAVPSLSDSTTHIGEQSVTTQSPPRVFHVSKSNV
ncbi:unnamed protein product, partial [Didymodactylos carnosus]